MAIVFFNFNGAGSGGGGPVSVNTSNGIVGDGSVGNPVQLGGPMVAFTDINIDSASNLRFVGFDGSDLFCHLQVGVDLVHADGGSLTTGNGLFNIGIVSGDVVATIGAVNVSNQLQSLEFINDEPGFVRDQKNGVGLTGQSLFAVSNDPNQFAQYGNLNPTVASLNVPGIINIDSDLNYNVPAGGGFFRVNMWGLYRTGIGTVNLTINYTDLAGNAQTIIITSLNTGNPNDNINPFVFQAQSLSIINLHWGVVGLITYDTAGTIERLLA